MRWRFAIDCCGIAGLLLTSIQEKSLNARSFTPLNAVRHRSTGSPFYCPTLQRAASSESLFVIPYGKARNEIYIEAIGAGEGDGDAVAPSTFRLLPNGHLAIFRGREQGSALQVFNQQGRLLKPELYT